MRSTFKKSTLTSLLALIIFAGMFRSDVSVPLGRNIAALVGIVVCSILTILFWLIERSSDDRTFSLGIWIVAVILAITLLLFLFAG